MQESNIREINLNAIEDNSLHPLDKLGGKRETGRYCFFIVFHLSYASACVVHVNQL